MNYSEMVVSNTMKYEAMKDSGIEWIGNIPNTWRIERGKNILWLLERPTKADDEIITCFRDGEVTLRRKRREQGFTNSLKEVGYQGIEPGDLVVHGMDGFAGSIGISDSRGKATPVLNVLNSSQNKKYIMYYLRTLAYRDVFMSLSTGIRVRSCDLRWNKLAILPFILPPTNEQSAIAEYLDNQCAKIDTLIDETKSSIEEYKKWKASLIFETVTKGLDPNVEMKDSKLGWAKKIPSTWEIYRLKSLFSFRKGLSITKADLVEGGVPVISYGQIHAKNNTGTHLSDELLRYVPDKYLEISPECLTKHGDIVLADTSEDLAGLGNAVLIDREEAVFAGYHTIIMNPTDVTNSKYLSYLLKTDCWRSQLRANASGIKVFSLTQKMLRGCNVILPPQQEQSMIVAYLDKKCSLIDSIIFEKTATIDDLLNYKQSIIFETVTGKRKVV